MEAEEHCLIKRTVAETDDARRLFYLEHDKRQRPKMVAMMNRVSAQRRMEADKHAMKRLWDAEVHGMAEPEYEVEGVHGVRLFKVPEFLVKYKGYAGRSWQCIDALVWTDDEGALLVNEELLKYLDTTRPSGKVCAAISLFGVVF